MRLPKKPDPYIIGLVKEYRFHNWRKVNLTDERGLSVHDYYDLLSSIWNSYTCAPRMRGEWNPKNKTLGQCSITAFLMQDIFGGEVYGVPLGDGNYHCFNVVEGQVFDLTSEQFGEQVLDYDSAVPQTRQQHFAKEEKRQRYEYLKRRLKEAIRNKKRYSKFRMKWREFMDFGRRTFLFFFLGLAGTLFMAGLQIYQLAVSGEWYLLGGVGFYSLTFVVLLVAFFLRNKTDKFIAWFFALNNTVIFAAIPVMLVYVLRYKEYKPMFVDWYPYAYALYGVIKMVTAIVGFRRAFRGVDIFLLDRKVMSMISAFYTLFLMAFTLISSQEGSTISSDMYAMLIALNILVLIVALLGDGFMYYLAIQKSGWNLRLGSRRKKD